MLIALMVLAVLCLACAARIAFFLTLKLLDEGHPVTSAIVSGVCWLIVVVCAVHLYRSWRDR